MVSLVNFTRYGKIGTNYLQSLPEYTSRKKFVLMYENGKMRHVETILGMVEGGNEE
jgi:hypothetical protein